MQLLSFIVYSLSSVFLARSKWKGTSSLSPRCNNFDLDRHLITKLQTPVCAPDAGIQDDDASSKFLVDPKHDENGKTHNTVSLIIHSSLHLLFLEPTLSIGAANL